ncbi:MAG: peptidylprolyl isomerase [Prochlorococcaceae cyanobacterium]
MPTLDPARLARYGLLHSYLRQALLEELLAPVALEQEEREAARQQFMEKLELREAADLQAYARDQCLGPADLDYRITYPVRIWKYCQQHFAPKAESRFLARKQSLDQVVYSLLRTKDPGLARELFLQVSEGEADFGELAVRYAEGPERATRGIVGPVPLDQGHPELVGRLRAVEPGVVLEPFAIKSWWLLVRLESLLPAGFGPDAADAMTQELLNEWLEEEVSRRLEALATGTASLQRGVSQPLP